MQCFALRGAADIDPSLRLEPVQVLGKGSFGIVYSARPAGTAADPAFALKRVTMRSSGKVAEVEAERKAMQEGQMLMRIIHPNVVRYHTVYVDGIPDPQRPLAVCSSAWICVKVAR